MTVASSEQDIERAPAALPSKATPPARQSKVSEMPSASTISGALGVGLIGAGLAGPAGAAIGMVAGALIAQVVQRFVHDAATSTPR